MVNKPKSFVLVTGGAGYIGSHTVKLLLERGYSVVVLDNFSRGFHEPLKFLKKYGSLAVVKGDITKKADLKKVFQKYKIDAVLHFAALCLPDESMRVPARYYKTNRDGTRNLLQAMQEARVNKIIFSSTCAIYGNSVKLPIGESHPKKPISPYGASKLAAEKIIKAFGTRHAMRYVIFRYFNVTGADQNGEIGDSKKPSELLVQNAVRGALGLAEFKATYQKVSTPDGSPIRDFVDVLDLADAHLAALRYLEKNHTLICNLGSGSGMSVKEIIDAVRQELGIDFKTQTGKSRRGDPEALYADIRLAKKKLNWRARRTLSESIKSLAKWYTKHPKGYIL